MPEAAIAHDRDDALVGFGVEGGRSRATEPVAHGGRADIEGRQDREEMAADVAAHMVWAEFALDELHRREDRPLRAARAEGGWTRLHLRANGLDRGLSRIVALRRALLG